MAVESLVGLFERYGLIAADFAGYREILSSGRVFSFGSGVGFNGDEALDAALRSPSFLNSSSLKGRVRIATTSTSSAKLESLSVDQLFPFRGQNDVYYCHYTDESLGDKVRVSLFALNEV